MYTHGMYHMNMYTVCMLLTNNKSDDLISAVCMALGQQCVYHTYCLGMISYTFARHRKKEEDVTAMYPMYQTNRVETITSDPCGFAHEQVVDLVSPDLKISNLRIYILQTNGEMAFVLHMAAGCMAACILYYLLQAHGRVLRAKTPLLTLRCSAWEG